MEHSDADSTPDRENVIAASWASQISNRVPVPITSR